MTTGPQYPTSPNERSGLEEEEPIRARAGEEDDTGAEEQEPPQGGRPGKGPLGHPYGGRGDVPDNAEGLPGEWESHEVRQQPRQRPSGPG